MQRQETIQPSVAAFAAFVSNLITTGLRLWLHAVAAFAARTSLQEHLA